MAKTNLNVYADVADIEAIKMHAEASRMSVGGWVAFLDQTYGALGLERLSAKTILSTQDTKDKGEGK